MDADSEDFVARRKSTRPRKAQVLLDESESSDDDFCISQPKKTRAVPEKSKSKTDNGTKAQRLSRDEKLFNRDLKKALVESKSTPNHQDPVVTTESSPGESMSGSASDLSDYLPDVCSGSDEDFEPSPLPTKPAKKPTKQSAKAKPSSKTKMPAKKAEGAISRPASKNKKAVACKVPEAVNSLSLPGSMPLTSRPVATNVKPGRTVPGNIKSSASPRITKTAEAAPPVTGAAEGAPGKAARKSFGARTKWVPPSKVDSTTPTTCNSPQGRLTGAPVIRVGLSRKAPIKPLHQTPLKTKN